MRRAYEWGLVSLLLVSIGLLAVYGSRRHSDELKLKHDGIVAEFSGILGNDISEHSKIMQTVALIAKSSFHRDTYNNGPFEPIDELVRRYYETVQAEEAPLPRELLVVIFEDKCDAVTSDFRRSKATSVDEKVAGEFSEFAAYVQLTLSVEQEQIVGNCKSRMWAALNQNIEDNKPAAQRIGEAVGEVTSTVSDSVSEGMQPLRKTYDEFWSGFESKN